MHESLPAANLPSTPCYRKYSPRSIIGIYFFARRSATAALVATTATVVLLMVKLVIGHGGIAVDYV